MINTTSRTKVAENDLALDCHETLIDLYGTNVRDWLEGQAMSGALLDHLKTYTDGYSIKVLIRF